MKIIITGGAGYIGTKLTSSLLSDGHKVTVIDNCWFGNFLKKNKKFKLIKKDIRKFNEINIPSADVLIHLANIANDPSVELNPNLSWEVNVLASKQIAEHAIKKKIKKIIFFSSGSVYGVKKEKNVTEELSLRPISIYNKTKMIAERVFLSYGDKIDIICLRPATVCGLSKRLRLDLTVNKLTFDGFFKKKIFVDGGKQIRPNVNINDLVRVVKHFLLRKKFNHSIYNVGFENLSIKKIAQKIAKKTKAKIIIKRKKDIRSYRQDSRRLIKTGFNPKFDIDLAIDGLIEHFSTKKVHNFGVKNFNLKQMKKINVK